MFSLVLKPETTNSSCTKLTDKMSTDTNTLYGLTPTLPADQSATKPATDKPQALTPTQFPVPSTSLASRINNYTKAKLPPQTYSHSLRVYTYGCAIANQCFPQWNLDSNAKLNESWFITAMLHDIGTTPEHIVSTKLSYEFWAGYHALEILQNESATAPHHGDDVGQSRGVASREQAESIAEAIIRHQDVQDKGRISLLTRLIHMGTLLDNIGAGKELVHPDTIRAVNEVYDRRGWSGCFRDTVVKEKELKPWAMVSRIEGFEETIESNGKGLMKEWDEGK
ncbi:hypothetical protein LTR51_004487 [Lithohypha guttulata]|nr:hypothetical protein LTR51_004487 [Lithohypha guttulata]